MKKVPTANKYIIIQFHYFCSNIIAYYQQSYRIISNTIACNIDISI